MWCRRGFCPAVSLLLCALASKRKSQALASAFTGQGQWQGGPEDWKCDNSSVIQNRTVCIIHSVISRPSLSINFDGDILFCNGAAITTTQGTLLINATGNILVQGNTKVKAEQRLNLLAADILVSDSSALLAEHGDLTALGRNISLKVNATATTNGGHINLTAPYVAIQDHTHARSTSNSGGVIIHAGRVVLSPDACIEASEVFINPPASQGLSNAEDEAATAGSDTVVLAGFIVAANISVRVHGDAILTGCLQGPKSSSFGTAADAPLDSVWILAQRNLTLDTESNWNMGSLGFFAENIRIANSHLKTLGSSCDNRPSSRLDQCAQYTQLIPLEGTNSSPTWQDANISFDLLLVARTSLRLQEKAYVVGGSMLLCSKQSLALEETTLDARGRGCGPGQGLNPGGAGGPHCRAGGGGSHEGRGGAGADYNATDVASCSFPGEWPVLPADDLIGPLPTAGASGGGCSVNKRCQCNSDTTPCAAAGGLIWLSGQQVSLSGKVQLLADGSPGVANKTANASETDVSGGGAGGHILLWVSSTSLSLDSKPTVVLSATGGTGECTRRQVSGAGGGGYIGVNYQSPDHMLGDMGLTCKVDGGQIDADCLPNLPRHGIPVTYGNDGRVSSVLPCPPGQAGPVCTKCKLGQYSTGSSAFCLNCTNKPATENALWTNTGWHNHSCPYKCVASVPDVRTNPKCLPAPSFVIQFFGGLRGALLILLCFIAVSGYLLWRRARNRKRRHRPREEQSWRLKRFPCSGTLSRVSSACRARFFRCCKRSRDNQNTGDVVFTKEQLPYHVCRVFLCGQNDSPCPWGLSSHLPTVAEPLVLAEQWELFAAELNALAEIPGRERLYKAALGICCPPLVASLACCFRRRRAKAMQQYTQRCSEGTNGARLWKPIRCRCQATGELAMVLGYDQGATLAYLDFFDFSRSQLDWAPVDLREDARVLVAHGKGTYSDPFCLDMGDPLVAHLAQGDFGAVAVCAVISTFNRLSRTFRTDEFGAPSYQVAWLRQKVEQCAAQCGLADMVHVFTCQHRRGRSRDAHSRRCSVQDVSFMDLVPPPEGREGDGRGGQDSALAGGGNISRHSLTPTTETKLCLAFASPLALQHQPRTSASASASPSPARQAQGAAAAEALTSPLPYAQLWEHLSATSASMGQSEGQVQCQGQGQGQGQGLGQGPGEAQCQGQASAGMGGSSRTGGTPQEPLVGPVGSGDSGLRRWWQALQVDHGSTTPATVLVIVIILLFTDLLACILVGVMIIHISRGAFIVWMLVPPLTQALALVLGPIFMLSERPRLGRLYAKLTLWSAVSAACTTVALLLVQRQQVEYWLFNFAELLTLCLLKAGLYLFSSMHVSNLEAAWDLSFMDVPQADFLGQILSTENSRGMGASAGQPNYLLPQPHLQQPYSQQPYSQDRHSGEHDGIQLPTERTSYQSHQSEFQSYAERLQLQPWALRVGAAQAQGQGLSQGLSQGQGQGQYYEGRPESFLQPYMRSSEESSGSKGGTTGGLDSLRHSSGRSWEGLSLASSPAEPSPF